jgi:hypothetical protein
VAPAPVADPTTDLDFGGATGAPEQPQPDSTPDDKPFDDEPFNAGVEADEEADPKKFIEQLTGKLGQSLRKYNEAQPQPDFELEKFAINSLLSATHTGEMDAEDQTDIIKKVKSSGNEQGGEGESSEVSPEESPEEDLDGLGGIEDFDGEEKPEEEVEEHILEKKENFFLDKPKRSSIFAPEGSEEFMKQNIIPESDNNKSAKKQFSKDLESDPNYLEFKKNGKGFGIPNAVSNDPFIKKTKNTRVGKEDEVKDSRRTTENLIVKGKNSIFSKAELIAKLHETFNQEDSTETQLVEPTPTKEPKIAPSVVPAIKPSRRNKPFLPSPMVQPDPKAKI